MAYSKVTLNGETVIDLTQDTVTSGVLKTNETAHGADGEPVIGAYSGGGGETTASQKDVNFIDFDGTIRYSYTASEFAALTALPANPSHSGLTSQGWNWSLADAKAYVAAYGMLDIGVLYYPLAAVLIVGIVNAVNLTDGIDGLDGSVTFFAGIFIMMIAGNFGRTGLSVMAASISGRIT